MDKVDQQILEALKEHSDPGRSSFAAIVKENYPGKDYIDVEDLAGTPYPEVRKRSAIDDKKGILITPVKDSTVIITKLSGADSSSFFVSAWSEVESVKIQIEDSIVEMNKEKIHAEIKSMKLNITKDEVTINDGSEDGLVKIKDLVTKLNNIEKAFNQHITEFNTHTHLDPVSGSLPAPTTSSTLNLLTTQQRDLENTKVTHGK